MAVADHHAVITCVTVDCHDVGKVATFWNAALGWSGAVVAPDGSSAVCRPAEGGLYLEFVRVPEDKVVKNRVHLGCTAGALGGLDSEIERLVALGATIAWEEEFPPEGERVLPGSREPPRRDRRLSLLDRDGRDLWNRSDAWGHRSGGPQ